MLRMDGLNSETVLGQHDHRVQTGDFHIRHLADVIRAWPHVRY